MTSNQKGGYLARNAALLCQNKEFRLYLDRRRRAKFNLDIPDGTHTVEDARDFLCSACEITSRAELDHDIRASLLFRQIKANFQHWQHKRHQQAL